MLPALRSRSTAAIACLRSQLLASTSHPASSHPSEQPSTSSSSNRSYAAASEETKPAEAIGNDKVQALASQIMGLTVLEASWLSDILRKRLNIQKPAFGSMPMAAMQAAAAPAPAAASTEAAAAPPAEKKEKTEFEVKLASFTTEGKIKVIKEIRAITSLGLKEAKELVEKAPVTIKANVPKADAEKMKQQIEAAGAKVELL